MRHPIPDWKWACIAGSSLFGIAALLIFVIHLGGFEEQVIWFILLLPGSLPAGFLSDLVYKIAPSAERVIYWMLFVSFNFGWYWSICYVIIKIFRELGWKNGLT
jgi:hypothetical protein